MHWLKTIIHAHTNYSPDANCAPGDLIATARAQGVDCVAITDHDEIDGALEARALGGVHVIVGEEISTADGHVIGLFLERRIPPGLSAADTARAIKAQGGLVLAPHPFVTVADDSLGLTGLKQIERWLDAVEICNAQNPLPWQDAQAARYARQQQHTAYCGADTHLRGHLAAAYQWLPPFAPEDPSSFLAALRAARLVAGRFGPSYFIPFIIRHCWDKLSPVPIPGFGRNAPCRNDAPQPI